MIGDRIHRLYRVRNQVQQYLPQLALIGKQLWKALTRRPRWLALLPLGATANDLLNWLTK